MRIDPPGRFKGEVEILTTGAAVGLAFPVEMTAASAADPARASNTLSGAEREMCAKLGIPEADFIKARADRAQAEDQE